MSDQVMPDEKALNDNKLVGKKRSLDETGEVIEEENGEVHDFSNNPMQAIMMENLNQSHNT